MENNNLYTKKRLKAYKKKIVKMTKLIKILSRNIIYNKKDGISFIGYFPENHTLKNDLSVCLKANHPNHPLTEEEVKIMESFKDFFLPF